MGSKKSEIFKNSDQNLNKCTSNLKIKLGSCLLRHCINYSEIKGNNLKT